MLDRNNNQWRVQDLIKNMQNGRLTFDIPVQRNDVWSNRMRGELIRNMLNGLPIGQFNFVRHVGVNTPTYAGIDGKQRSTTLMLFLDNKFRIDKNVKDIVDREGNPFYLGGYKFSQLPDWLKETLLDYSLTVYYYDDDKITEDEIIELVNAINSGKSWTPVEKRRLMTKSLSVLKELAQHPAIANSSTDKLRRGFGDEQIIMQLWIMIFDKNPSFSQKKLADLAKDVSITKVEEQTISDALDYVDNLLSMIGESDPSSNILRKMKLKTHFISLAYMASLAISHNVSQDEYNQKAIDLFTSDTGATISQEYNDAIQHGSTKPANIKKKMEAIQSHLLGQKLGQQTLI